MPGSDTNSTNIIIKTIISDAVTQRVTISREEKSFKIVVLYLVVYVSSKMSSEIWVWNSAMWRSPPTIVRGVGFRERTGGNKSDIMNAIHF